MSSIICNGQITDNHLVIGSVDSVYSTILKENRKIWVHMPDTTDAGVYSKQRYPVVFLLDGDAHFYEATGVIQFLSELNNICPKMIVVGIPNTDRMRDLTPSHDRTVPKDSNYTRSSGGGERFTEFMEKELIPYIDAHYPTTPYKVLIGHSLGGLLVVNTLVHHTSLFNAYIAIDPALYWDNQKVLKEAESILKQKKFADRYLFMGISKSLPEGMDSLTAMKDTTLATIFIRPLFKLNGFINSDANNGLHYGWKYYDGETHNSVPLPALYDGLHSIFDFLPLPEMDKDAITTDFYKNHYKLVSEKMGYKIPPPEELVNGRGYYFLGKMDFEKARSFFQMNIDNYPGSYNVYDSMSDLYAAENNREKAIEFINKELKLMDKPYIRQKLRELQAAK